MKEKGVDALFDVQARDGGEVNGPLGLVGIAEIAELAGMTRQAITNLRDRDNSFPAPVAKLRSGPVFEEVDIRRYLEKRGKAAPAGSAGRLYRKKGGWFDPLDRTSLAASIKQALLEEPLNQLPPELSFQGSGIYAIYYDGDYQPYDRLSERQIPLFVARSTTSKTIWMEVDESPSNANEPVLFNRLREHGRAIQQVEKHGRSVGGAYLRLSDFRCRFLLLDDMWAPLGLSMLLGHFKPVWNQVLLGFANHDPGGGRRRGARPDWDELHPGRPWALKQEQPGGDPRESLERIAEHIDSVLRTLS